ncbi:MAG: fumarylacetoacetate hydrolase family protein [Planctomycetota bacterium]
MIRGTKSAILPVICVVVVGFLVAAAGQMAAGRDSAKVDKMIRQMLAARENQEQIAYLTATYGSFSMAEAYEIQAALAKRLSRTLGDVAGYKVAYASKAAQEQFGVDEPAYGPLFSLGRLPSGSRLPTEEIMEVTLETEVAFTISGRISRPIKSVEELKSYVKWVHAAFDIGDYRFISAEARPTPQDMIASGVGAHFYTLGPAAAPDAFDVDAATLKLARDGETIVESAATNVMGSPWNSLLWLANHLVRHGGGLKPGDVVLTGTAAPAYKAKAADMKGSYEGDCGALGKVTLTIY